MVRAEENNQYLGLRVSPTGYWIPQAINPEPEVKKVIMKIISDEWRAAKDWIDVRFAQRSFEYETHPTEENPLRASQTLDYGTECRSCKKTNIEIKEKFIHSPFPFVMTLTKLVCPNCKMKKSERVNAFNAVTAKTYIVKYD